MDGLHSSIVRDMDATNKYYTEISDLISLKAPSKDKLSRAIEASKQSLSETEKRLTAFNGKQATSELDAILNNQNKGLTKVSGTVTMASPYRNPEALAIYRNPHFKKAANRYHQKVDSLARAYFQKNHPGVAFDKDKAGIEELQALAREVTKKAEYGGEGKNQTYTLEEAVKDFAEGLTPSEFSKETIGAFLDHVKGKVIEESKNIGRSLAATLQPRDAAGRFIKDSSKMRNWLTSTLKKIPNSTSKVLGNVAKWGGRGLVALGMWSEGSDHYKEHHNVGRAVSYGVTAGTAGFLAGKAVGAIVGSAFAGAATGLLPIVVGVGAAVVVGSAVSVGVKALYKNVKPFRAVVDGAGDLLNGIGKGISNIGKSFSNPLKAIKGVFG